MDFQVFWPLVSNHGRVAHLYRAECEQLWRTYSDEQQRAIYEAIERKLLSGRFVSYRPTDAIRDNAPKKLIISADEYYRRYGTQANQDGWVRVFLPDEQRTIYVKG